jgi:membrane-associated protease RseP (regulator of RpoE activity)
MLMRIAVALLILQLGLLGVVFYLALATPPPAPPPPLPANLPPPQMRAAVIGAPGMSPAVVLALNLERLTPDQAKDLDLPGGYVIAGITPGSPAAESGLRVGDVILTVEDEPIPDLEALARLRRGWKPDQVVRVGVLRGDQRLAFPVRLLSRARHEELLQRAQGSAPATVPGTAP